MGSKNGGSFVTFLYVVNSPRFIPQTTPNLCELGPAQRLLQKGVPLFLLAYGSQPPLSTEASVFSVSGLGNGPTCYRSSFEASTEKSLSECRRRLEITFQSRLKKVLQDHCLSQIQELLSPRLSPPQSPQRFIQILQVVAATMPSPPTKIFFHGPRPLTISH